MKHQSPTIFLYVDDNTTVKKVEDGEHFFGDNYLLDKKVTVFPKNISCTAEIPEGNIFLHKYMNLNPPCKHLSPAFPR